MKLRHAIMLGGLALGIWLVFFSEKPGDDTVVELLPRHASRMAASVPVETSGRTQETEGAEKDDQTKHATHTPAILALRNRSERALGGAEADEDKNLFAGRAWTLPIAKVDKSVAPVITAPPLPFVFIGKQFSNGRFEIFLMRGEKTFVAREHSIIDGAYRVDAIAAGKMSMTYLPLNQNQNLSIGATE